MEDTQEVRKGEFVWKIDNFLKLLEEEDPEIESHKFKFVNYECHLDLIVSEIDDVNSKSYVVFLNESTDVPIHFKTSCKMCLIDGRGEEFLVTKRTTLKFHNYVHLITIWESDLDCKENELLPDGVLTLRLSWCDTEERNQERATQTALDINSEEERSELQTLSEDFVRFYESKMDTDFLLRVGESLIPVHRAVLSARSEVFAAMFRHDTSENRSGVVEIPDVTATVLSDVLYYVYSGKARGMSADTIVPMYVVADKYALIELRDTCLDVLMRSLTVENVCDAAVLAHTHGEPKLEEEVVQFLKENLKEIEETNKWNELLKSKSSLAVKLLRSALRIYIDKDKSSSSK